MPDVQSHIQTTLVIPHTYCYYYFRLILLLNLALRAKHVSKRAELSGMRAQVKKYQSSSLTVIALDSFVGQPLIGPLSSIFV